MVVAAIPGIVIDESDRGRRTREEILVGPTWTGGSSDDSVGGKRRAGKTSVECDQRDTEESTVRRTTTRGPYRVFAGIYYAVGKDEVLHRRAGRDHIADDEQVGRRKSCDVIDHHVLKDRCTRTHQDLCKFTRSAVDRKSVV